MLYADIVTGYTKSYYLSIYLLVYLCIYSTSPSLVCIIVSKIDENRCKQTRASLP